LSPHNSSTERADLRDEIRWNSGERLSSTTRPQYCGEPWVFVLLSGSGDFGGVRKRACAVHRRFIAHLRRQRDPRPAATLDWLRNISGKGLVLTAAHVAGLAAQTKPSVRIAGMERPANALKEDHRVDLTLLSIDGQELPIYLQMRRMPLCEKPSRVGEPVIVAIPEGTARSRIMSPQLLPPDMRKKFPTVISDVATTGNSGSGVFDAGSKCLLGIMSSKIYVRPSAETGGEQRDIAKYFVPASTIRAFIPTEFRF
jgi:hypothetical protein